MKPRTKPALILLATLLVGILIGSLSTSAVINSRLEQITSLRTRGGFSDVLEAVIQPTDAEQKAQIRAVVERTGARMGDLYREGRKMRDAIGDSMRAELKPLLTPAQNQRLDAWFERPHRGASNDRRRSDPEHRPDRPPPDNGRE